MKVKTLIEYLKELPASSIIYLSSDAEGNSYAELSEDIEATGNTGAVVLYPLHKVVELDWEKCKPCDTEQITIDGDCSVCGRSSNNK